MKSGERGVGAARPGFLEPSRASFADATPSRPPRPGALWKVLRPLMEAVRPRCRTPHHDLRRTIAAIIWRHRDGATWRGIPAELGPWWAAAQTSIRWARLGVWERLLDAAQARRVELGMAFLDGTSIRGGGRPFPGAALGASAQFARLPCGHAGGR